MRKPRARFDKSCKNCGKQFLAKSNQFYCHWECQVEFAKKVHDKKREQVVAKHVLANRRCQTCGKLLFGQMRKWCGDDCRGTDGNQKFYHAGYKKEMVFRRFPAAKDDLARLMAAWKAQHPSAVTLQDGP